MAQPHNALQRAGSLLRGFRRAVGLVDADAEGVSRLGETLQPVLDVWGRIEWAALRDEIHAWGRATAAAGGVGVRSQVQLRNPTGSGVLIVLQLAQVIAPTSGVGIGFSTTEYANVLSTRGVLDGRLTRSLRGQLRSKTTGAAEGAERWVLPDTGPFTVPVVIAPGTALYFEPGADNTAINVALWWSERTFLPGESPDELNS